MVFFIIPVGSIIRAGRAIANTKSKASKAVDRAFTDSPPKEETAASSSLSPSLPQSYVVTEEVSKWKPRLIARDDGIEVDPRDVHLIAASAGPPSPRAAIKTEDIELHEKKADSDADTAPPASSSSQYFVYYRLLNSDSSVFYTARLLVGDNHPDVGCQLCIPDDKDECPCMTSCGFDIRFDTAIRTISVVAPPSATATLSPPPASTATKGGLKGFISNMARVANETVLAERIQSQEIDIAYHKTEPRPDHPPTREVMDLNAVKPFHFYDEHTDCCFGLVYCQFRSKKQKDVGMQVIAMPREEGDRMAGKCTFYSCTAC